MEANEVLIGILSTIGIGWIVWVSTSVINLAKSNRSEDVSDLKRSFKEMEERVTASLSRQDLRQDNFFKTEIQELKAIIHKEGP